MTYRDRRLRRAERLHEWAGTRQQKSDASFAKALAAVAGIPPGQPIWVGHHSEKHHRRALDRHDRAMRAGIEHQEQAASMASRAAEIERQADRAIYDDDPDATEQLRARIADLERRRERMKAINRAIRTGTGWSERLSPPLTDDERTDIDQAARFSGCVGYPPYALQNHGGNITRQRQRLARLQGQAPTGATTADTATGRAGLIITAGMTTPRRAGKQPRPVWTVSGNIGPHRQTLTDLDGTWYRGAFSFWSDPTEALEAACATIKRDAASPRLCDCCRASFARGTSDAADPDAYCSTACEQGDCG
jgi:hypothetical protein